MNIFNKASKVSIEDFMSSELHNEHTFYDRLIDDLNASRSFIFIESPFIKSVRCSSLRPYLAAAHLRGVKVVVKTRPLAAHGEDTAYEAYGEVLKMKKDGVKVTYSYPKDHRKIVIIDDSIVYEGSLNVLSHFSSVEIMRRLQSRHFVREIRRFLKI